MAQSTPWQPSNGKAGLVEAVGGKFVRTDSTFRDFVAPDSATFPPAAGRYHLYVAHACPWANRCLATLYMKGLQDVIGVSVVHPTWARTRPDDPVDLHRGWQFADPATVATVSSAQGVGAFSTAGCVPDSLHGAKVVRDLYDIADPGGSTAKFTVPILWDKENNTIVNNESSEILRMLSSAFNAYATNPSLELYPEPLRPTIDAVNEWVYHGINNGVYKCGFASTQEAYDQAEEELFAAMDRAEALLSQQRYLAGDTFTEADLRLFMTLVRFDEVYVVYFKTNRKCVREYPNLFNFTKEVYQMPGVAESVNMEHIKMHYFTSHEKLNPFAIIPRGPCVDFSAPHDRARFSK